jgi:segregation and condensation protein A
MEKLSYHLPVFDGPLDLLLYLISKNKLDICDISIAELLDQYMEQIRAMQEQDMDVASEFLEMAARLVYLKTVSLLPRREEEEELRRGLTDQLLEYRQCRAAAQRLRFCYDVYVRAPMQLEPDQTYRRRHDPRELLAAYFSAAGRGRRFLPPPAESFSALVTHRPVSVASRIVFVLRRLWKHPAIPLNSLFLESRRKSELVATFLAVLELVKKRRVRVEGEAYTVKLVNGGVKKWK